MKPGWRRSLLWVGIGVAVLAAGIWSTYTFFTSRYPGGNDFVPRWVGGRALLFEGLSPYSDEVTHRVQVMLHGRPAGPPEEDRGYFAYPLYCLLLYWPLCLISDFALARAVWLWILLGVLLAAAVLWARVIGWRSRPGVWALTLLWLVFMYHDFRALVLGQLAVFVLLALVAALWAMDRGHDGWAGFFLALSTVKPQMVYLAVLWIMLWAAGQRRWRLWQGLITSMVLLALGSMLLVPSWPLDSIRQSLAYPSYTVYGSLTFLVVRYLLGLGQLVEIVATALLAAGVLVLAWRLWRGTWQQMVWMLGLLLLLTNFLTPRIATTNYVLLTPWALWGFTCMQQTWGRRGAWAVVATQALSLVGLWVLFLVTIEGNFETAPVYFPFPAAMLLLLGWLWGCARRWGIDVSR